MADPTALTLVFGGSRSGKSRWAEQLATRSGRGVVYIATAAERSDDPQWSERISKHRQRRPSHWQCIEAGPDLAETINGLLLAPELSLADLLLIDSLGTWLAQHLDAGPDDWNGLQQALLDALAAQTAPVVLVCEEVGLGVVPATAIGGLFRDRMGELQQRLMAMAADSWLVMAGRALNLHALAEPLDWAESLDRR